MSNLFHILDLLSKMTEGELAVLAQALSSLKTQVDNANATARTSLLWSQYSLKSQKNTNSNFVDPLTGLPIVEPDYQIVDGYPIIFGNATNSNIASRSTTFAFGAKAFLCYENDANGTPFYDTAYAGNTATDLSGLEVVNYRTLINTIENQSTGISQTYLNKSADESDPSSVHTLGSVYFRDSINEKVFYGSRTANPAKELAVKGDLSDLEMTIDSAISDAVDALNSTITETANTKLNKTGGEIIGSLKVTVGTND